MNRFKTSKKLFAVLTVITLFLALSITAYAKNPSVVDSAGLFTESQKTAIEAKVEETISVTGVDIVIVTTNDTQGKTSEAYSDDYFDYNGYGLGEERNGILLLINMGDREIHISLRGSGTNFFSDTNIENALDFMSPYASKGQYEKAVEYFLMDVQGLYNASINPDDGNNEYYGYGQYTEVYPNDQEAVVSPEPEKETQPPDTTSVIIAAIVVGLIAGGIVCLLVASKYKMKLGGYQYPFRAKSSVHMTLMTDTLVDRHVTQQRISDDNDHHNNNDRPSGGGGSRIKVSIGSSHVSSSGASHRGSTRGF